MKRDEPSLDAEAEADYKDRYATQRQEDEVEQASLLWHQRMGHTSTQETEERVAQTEQEIIAKLSCIRDLAKQVLRDATIVSQN